MSREKKAKQNLTILCVYYIKAQVWKSSMQIDCLYIHAFAIRVHTMLIKPISDK